MTSKDESFLPSWGSLHAIKQLQQSIGNRAVTAIVLHGGIPNSTRISRPDEPAERSADQMAAAVMQNQTLPDAGKHANLKPFQRPTVMDASIQSLLGPGRPLPVQARQFFELRLGVDLGQVRIHHDDKAAGLAEAIQACAFTTGRHIGFNRQAYNPGSLEGRRLLAHELAHSVNPSSAQQSAVIWRESGVRVRSPVLDETLMQYTSLWSAGRGGGH